MVVVWNKRRALSSEALIAAFAHSRIAISYLETA
jgi:hypothetical protein